MDRWIDTYHALYDSHATQFCDAGSINQSIYLSIWLSIYPSIYLQAEQEAEGPMTVAVFSHGIAIRSFVRGILGADVEFTVHAETDNCSLTVLEYRPGPADPGGLGGWVLKCLNA